MAKAVRGDVARALLLAKKAPRRPRGGRGDRRRGRLRGRARRLEPRRDRQRAERSGGQVAGGRPRSSAGQGLDLDLAERGDRLAVGALDLARLLRPGGEDDRGDLEAGGAGRLERQQRVVDRAEPGGGGDRPAGSRGRRRGRGPGSRAASGTSRPPTPSQTRASAPAAAARAASRSRSGLDLLAGQRRGQVRRGRRPVAVGGDLLVALVGAGGAAQQLVVGLARLLEAGDGGLEDGDPRALGGRGCGRWRRRPRSCRPRCRCR